MPSRSPFRYFKTSPEIIRLAVMLYVRCPLSLRNVEDLLHERGIDVSHETVRFWWHRFGPMFASEIRRRRIGSMRSSNWRWHLDEVFVKINGDTHYLWRAVDHEGEVLESFVTKAALKFLRKRCASTDVSTCTRPSSTTSTRNAASPAGTSSRRTAPPLSPSGAASARDKGQLSCHC